MKASSWLIPLFWAFGGGFSIYFLLGSIGVGAATEKDFFVLRENRHRLVGLVSAGVGFLGGVLLVQVRLRSVAAAIGAVTGALIGSGAYWDLGQPEPLQMGVGFAATLAVLGVPLGLASVRPPDPALPGAAAGTTDVKP